MFFSSQVSNIFNWKKSLFFINKTCQRFLNQGNETIKKNQIILQFSFFSVGVLPLLLLREYAGEQNPPHGRAWNNHRPNDVPREFYLPSYRENV